MVFKWSMVPVGSSNVSIGSQAALSSSWRWVLLLSWERPGEGTETAVENEAEDEDEDEDDGLVAWRRFPTPSALTGTSSFILWNAISLVHCALRHVGHSTIPSFAPSGGSTALVSKNLSQPMHASLKVWYPVEFNSAVRTLLFDATAGSAQFIPLKEADEDDMHFKLTAVFQIVSSMHFWRDWEWHAYAKLYDEWIISKDSHQSVIGQSESFSKYHWSSYKFSYFIFFLKSQPLLPTTTYYDSSIYGIVPLCMYGNHIYTKHCVIPHIHLPLVIIQPSKLIAITVWARLRRKRSCPWIS